MAAVAFFYAGILEIQWQLLIVVIFLFVGTLAFFSVLFDETSDEATEPLVQPVILHDDDDNNEYPYDRSANA
jgi:hypothetical protein